MPVSGCAQRPGGKASGRTDPGEERRVRDICILCDPDERCALFHAEYGHSSGICGSAEKGRGCRREDPGL